MKQWIKFWKGVDKNCDGEILKKEYDRVKQGAKIELLKDMIIDLEAFVNNEEPDNYRFALDNQLIDMKNRLKGLENGR